MSNNTNTPELGSKERLAYYELIKSKVMRKYPNDKKIQEFMFKFYENVPTHFEPLTYEDITKQYPGIDSWWYIENCLCVPKVLK
jgi:hypothetical protein